MSAWRTCRASPSLALLKYWGKLDGGDNLPATPSLSVTLGGLWTETAARPAETDSVSIAGVLQGPGRFASFLDHLRSVLGVSLRFEARSVNSFPTAAGLASSSSGFAALAGACARAAGRDPAPEVLSDIARMGSVSAARAVFGGFVLLPAGARAARQLHDADHWPGLRIVVAVTEPGRKPQSSREGMQETRARSPYYGQWLSVAPTLLPGALQALEMRDIEKLGEAVRWSSGLMHAAILATRPPLLYWLPATVAVMRTCEELRKKGIGAWETVDAGPQVKILCLEADAERVAAAARESAPGVQTLVCAVGPGLSHGLAEEPGS